MMDNAKFHIRFKKKWKESVSNLVTECYENDNIEIENVIEVKIDIIESEVNDDEELMNGTLVDNESTSLSPQLMSMENKEDIETIENSNYETRSTMNLACALINQQLSQNSKAEEEYKEQKEEKKDYEMENNTNDIKMGDAFIQETRVDINEQDIIFEKECYIMENEDSWRFHSTQYLISILMYDLTIKEIQMKSGLTRNEASRLRKVIIYLGKHAIFSWHLFMIKYKWIPTSNSNENEFHRDPELMEAFLEKHIIDFLQFETEIEVCCQYLFTGKDESQIFTSSSAAVPADDDVKHATPVNTVRKRHYHTRQVSAAEEEINSNNELMLNQTDIDPNLRLTNIIKTSVNIKGDIGDDGDGYVVKGYSQVLHPFQETVESDVRLNHQVTYVNSLKCGKSPTDYVEVVGRSTTSGVGFRAYGKYVVCTVPLGILKLSLLPHKMYTKNLHEIPQGIVFKPSLSQLKQNAIQKMEMGIENKCYVRFTHCFWTRNIPYFQSVQHPEYRFVNLSYHGFGLPANTNVLCTMVAPTKTSSWMTQTPALELRIVWDVLLTLASMFSGRICNENERSDVSENSDGQRYYDLGADDSGKIFQLLVDYKVSDWAHNLYTRGSYSYLACNSLYEDIQAIKETENKCVFFAGEATSMDAFQCVDGAHETGFDCAKEIHQLLRKSK